MPYQFDGSTKTITILGSGEVEITANDIYSRWVDWVQSGLGAGFDEVIKTIGGESIGGGLTSGVYVFLGLGWSLVVPSSITTLIVEGNVARDPDDTSGAPLYINQGAAMIIREVSVVALGYSTMGGGGGLTVAQLRSALDAYPVAKPNDLQVTINPTPITVEPTPVTVDGGFSSTNAADLAAAKSAAESAQRLLTADERIRADRYQKLAAGTAEIILDKDVRQDGQDIDIVEHS